MKHNVAVIGPVVAMFLVSACAENAKPPNAAQQNAQQAEEASQKAQKQAQDAREQARIAQQKDDEARQQLQHKRAEERQAEQRAQQASHQAGYAEQQAGATVPRTAAAPRIGATEAQGSGAGGQAGQAAAPKVIVVTAGLLFPSNGAELSPAAMPKLDELAAALRAKPEANNVIAEGFTDDRGDAAHNKVLSQRRAQAVSDYLASRGIPRDRIMTRGLGAASPVSTEKTVEGRAVNRRVEIVIRPASSQSGK
jgi:outer membrane protein OmpA-like peptidoglycan-associated protein